MTDFVHLHLHTEYSLLDGAVRLLQVAPDPNDPKKTIKTHPLCEALKARGMDAVAITDHGNMYGAHTFVSVLRADGIKPIIGQEFYVADDMYAKTADVLKQRYHLILLAKNMTGYKNLMKLSSLAFVDGFYMKPRIDLQHIREHSEGLICLSACLAGKVPHLLLQGKYEEAKAAAIEMRDIFEPGDFYIELQDHHLPEDKIVMNPLCQIAREIGVKVVATNDVHYIEKEDADIQDTMMCITLGCKKSEINGARFDTDEGSYAVSGGSADGSPRSLYVTAEQMRDAVIPLVDDIIEVIMSVLNQTPPELSAEILRKGIFVSGGSLHIPGLIEYLEQALELPVTPLKDVENAIAIGGARFFEERDLLSDMLGVKLY